MVTVLAVVVVLAGATILAGVGLALWCRRTDGPDTATIDPYGLAGRESDAPELDLAHAVGFVPVDGWMAAEADGSHDYLDVDPWQLAAEVVWLYELMPEASAWAGDFFATPAEQGPPVIPGPDTP